MNLFTSSLIIDDIRSTLHALPNLNFIIYSSLLGILNSSLLLLEIKTESYKILIIISKLLD